MYIVVGLGNPGKKYDNTRHNVGFMAIDEIAKDYKFPEFSKKFSGLTSKGKIGNEDVILLKPQTYINLSGQSVSEIVNFYKLSESDVIVIHDDIDLEFAKVRVKVGGGSGGHNGIKSIDSHIGVNYKRIRIGIGRSEEIPVENYVLKSFSKEEMSVLVNDLLHSISKHFNYVFVDSNNGFLNEINKN